MINTVINQILETHFRRVEGARKARIARETQRVAAANNGAEPKEDSNGRFHAPFDGYFYEDVDREGTYLKGEFLPIPPSDSDDWAGVVYGHSTPVLRVKNVDPARAMELLGCDHVDGYTGTEFEKYGQPCCHLYLKGTILRSKPATRRATQWVQAPLNKAKLDAEQAEKARLAAAQPAPKGRVEVEGEIVSVRAEDGYYGDIVYKCLILTVDGWKLWCTLPAAIQGAQRGDKVRMTVTVTPSDDDEKFAFGKRPSKAIITEECEA